MELIKKSVILFFLLRMIFCHDLKTKNSIENKISTFQKGHDIVDSHQMSSFWLKQLHTLRDFLWKCTKVKKKHLSSFFNFN